MERTPLTLWGNDSLIILIIRQEIATYKTITDLQLQLHKTSKHRSDLIFGILWLLKIWEKESQEEFFEYYERLLQKACLSPDITDEQQLEKQARSIFKKLKSKAQSSIIARRQKYATPVKTNNTQQSKNQVKRNNQP